MDRETAAQNDLDTYMRLRHLHQTANTGAEPVFGGRYQMQDLMSLLQHMQNSPLARLTKQPSDPATLGGFTQRPVMNLGTIDVGGRPVSVNFDGQRFSFTNTTGNKATGSFGLGATKSVFGPAGISAMYQRSF